MLPQSWPLQPAGGIQNNQAACQQKIRLQSLQMERERLKQRQQEIMVSIVIAPRDLKTWLCDICNHWYSHAFSIIAARDDAAAEYHRSRHGSVPVGY